MSSVVVAGDRVAQVIATGTNQQQVVATKQPSASVILAGLRGPQGGASASYQHDQAPAAAEWIINHNLGYRPAVSLFTVGGMLMLANIQHISENQARAYFDNPTAGYAVCS